jgi:alkyldihydroxyacetonephosphate synthase
MPLRTTSSHWAWGAEPDPASLREIARLFGEHTGLGDLSTWEDPVPFDRVRLPAPRLPVPKALEEFCVAEPYERAVRTYGQA